MKKQTKKQPKVITEAMLTENPDFVKKVKTAKAKETMTVDQFQDWLNKI